MHTNLEKKSCTIAHSGLAKWKKNSVNKDTFRINQIEKEQRAQRHIPD
jgi:hypothetical protein